MKKILFILIFITLVIVNSGCEKEKLAPAGDIKLVTLTEKQKQIIAGSNTFGFDYFRKVNEISGSGENLMVSPLSVSMALGMTRNGAVGTTLEAMTNTLGFTGMTDTEINESYKSIVNTFTGLDPKVNLQIANSIWYSNVFSVEQPFILTNQQYFDATVTPLDFTSPTAVAMINNWVNEKTNELIPKIIDEIPDGAVMYLVNAVYFKGQWKYQFEAKNTALKPFYPAEVPVIQVSSMTMHATLPYFNGDGFEALELPYGQGNFIMSVILPDAGKSINDIIPVLTLENWNAWRRQFTDSDIQLQLPKFKYAYEEKQMKPILTDLGMGIAFSDKADFTRINQKGGLSISRVLHKSFIETNEEGTEAAAVTAVEVSYTSAGPDQPYFFTVNRPFIYFIQEKSTGTILFIGVVTNPNL